MPRVTHVKRAQQRYATVPVLDDDGKPKKTPVMRNGKQRVTKKGKPIFMTVTVADKTKPLPPYTCDFCRQEIAIGSPMKHITPKSGPYGGRKRTRHESCPNWQVWEYSSSLSARLAQVAHGFWEAIDAVESEDDVQSALDDAAEEIKGIAEEKREGASNIEEGFGHPTSASEELEQTADSLDEWAEEITGADIPEFPEPEEIDCEDCDGTGQVDTHEGDVPVDGQQKDCETCDGTGQYTPDEPTETQVDEWRDEVRDALSIVDESPV